jgi:hypothetical protein
MANQPTSSPLSDQMDATNIEVGILPSAIDRRMSTAPPNGLPLLPLLEARNHLNRAPIPEEVVAEHNDQRSRRFRSMNQPVPMAPALLGRDAQRANHAPG